MVGLLAVGTVALGACGQDAQTQQAPAAAQPATSAPAPAAPAAPAGIGPGEWLVGSQVEPGTYASTGPAEDGDYCLWSRKDTAGAGAMNGIIASDGSYDVEQMLVTIEASDVAFVTKGCAPFELVS